MNEDSNLKFLNDLKVALKNYGDIENEITPLELKKEQLRIKIKAWILMHNIIEFETFDISESSLWRMSITKSERRNVDHDFLASILPPETLTRVYTTTPVETFKCSKVKKHKSQKPSKTSKSTSQKSLPPEGSFNI